jgi:dynein heavy chain
VQRHINKCFEAIAQLQFTPQQHVSAMISAEKERVDFNKSVDVNEGEKKGNVERWLSEIEAVMIATLKRITKDSLSDQTERVKWVRKWPAQTVLAVNMIRWTEGAEHAIETRTIKEFVGRLVAELKDIVVLVRQELTELERLTLGALVTIDVHGKDVIEALERDNCHDIQ